MAIEDGLSIGDGLPKIGRVQRYLTTVLWRVVVTAVAIAWIVFWGSVARVHLLTGNLGSAGFVAVFLVLPPIVGPAYYLRGSLPLDRLRRRSLSFFDA